MAAARKVKLDCDASFSEAAKKTVKLRAAEVFAHSEGVLDLELVEGVHDMRVATRRLRAALEVFEPCFPHKRHRKALKKVKGLADALGERRDADVEIILLESLAEEATEADRGPLGELIEALRVRRAEANESLAPVVTPKRLKKLRRRLKKLVKKAGTDAAGPLRPNVGRIVSVRLDELRGLVDEALRPEASKAQHEMRIAAKRLRYVLEIFEPCLGEQADAAWRAAKQLQSILGDLHDCDLMLAKVEQIGSVAAVLRGRRRRLYRDFVALWQGEASRGTWAALETSL